jgi:hypothetical protein
MNSSVGIKEITLTHSLSFLCGFSISASGGGGRGGDSKKYRLLSYLCSMTKMCQDRETGLHFTLDSKYKHAGTEPLFSHTQIYDFFFAFFLLLFTKLAITP